jgi:hypothetical protein
MIEITAIRLEGGRDHEHITAVLWRATTSMGLTTRQAIVDWLSESSENRAVVADGTGWVDVAVERRPTQPPHLRTRMHGRWTDHLLSLPRF